MANSIKVVMSGKGGKPAGKVDNNAEVNRQIGMMRHLDRKTMKAGTIPANISNNGDDSFIVSKSPIVTTWEYGDICDCTDALKNIVSYPDTVYDVQKRIIGIIIAGNNGNVNNDIVILAKGNGYARKALDKAISAGDLLMYTSPSTWLLTPVTTDKSKAVARAEADALITDKYVRVNLDTKGGGGSSSVTQCPAKIGAKSGIFYDAALYENGIDMPSTRTVKLFILDLDFIDDVKTTWVIANFSAIGTTGGGYVP